MHHTFILRTLSARGVHTRVSCHHTHAHTCPTLSTRNLRLTNLGCLGERSLHQQKEQDGDEWRPNFHARGGYRRLCRKNDNETNKKCQEQMRNTTRTSCVTAALLSTPSSNLRSATSSPRPQPYGSALPSMALYTFTSTHSSPPLPNLSPPIHFPLLRYPLPFPRSTSITWCVRGFDLLQLELLVSHHTYTPFYIFPLALALSVIINQLSRRKTIKD